MKTNILMATVLSIGLFAACKPNNPPVTEQETSLLKGTWVYSYNMQNDTIEPVSKTLIGVDYVLNIDTNFTLLSDNRVELDSHSKLIWPDGSSTQTKQFDFKIVAKSYLYLTDDAGKTYIYKRRNNLPVIENKNKSLLGSWRFVKLQDMKSDYEITTDKMNGTSCFMQFTPLTNKNMSQISTKKIFDEDQSGSDTQGEWHSTYDFIFIYCDVPAYSGEIEQKEYNATHNIAFKVSHAQEINWQESPWKQIPRRNMLLGSKYELCGEKSDTLKFTDGSLISTYVYIGE